MLFLTTRRMLLNLNFQEVQQPVANMLRHSDEKNDLSCFKSLLASHRSVR